MLKQDITPEFLRSQIIGGDAAITTPFGERILLYADYTASGRGLEFVEAYITRLLAIYANTHTEDDSTGRTMTQLLHQAEQSIKTLVNAGEHGRVIACGSGATGAILKMQQIVGVALPPVTRVNIEHLLQHYLGAAPAKDFWDYCDTHQPVVFVGPYEHHSNEVSWRESLATVVEVRLDRRGGIDLEHLEQLLISPKYRNRPRIGSFSAASNVTGIRTPVAEIAALLHRYDALAFFDYAACAPYVDIDMNPASDSGGETSLDAVFVSAHKFLGGPGASGVLVFNQRCYHKNLPPTVAGGGTVDFVGPNSHDFIDDIETREKAGTPGILQIIKAALTFEIKQAVGTQTIEEREAHFLELAFNRWRAHPNIEILGDQDPRNRIGIVSFNIRDGNGRYLHPRFVTTLLNDLFGIQSRAGCSCAGPYGHQLLKIDDETALRYRHWVLEGLDGVKPGWCRVGFHYVFDEAEADQLIDCIEFIAGNGARFLPAYRFDLRGGGWKHRDSVGEEVVLGLAEALEQRVPVMGDHESSVQRRQHYAEYNESARQWLDVLPGESELRLLTLNGELGELQFFTLVEENLNSRDMRWAGP